MGGHVRIQKWLKGLVDGGDHELGRDDLLRQVEEGILALRRHGSRGMEVFPPAVRVYVEAVEGSLETLRGFVKDPSFEKDLEARLNNRLIAADTLPARRYEVLRAERSGVRVEEDSKTNLAILMIEGGDKDGQRIALETGRREWRMGRGRWHQERADDQRLPNDIVLSDTLSYISRASAILRRSGALLEVETRQQKEFLIIVRKDGAKLRPAMTASGRVPVRPGDRMEFHDGGQQCLTVHILSEEAP